MVLNICMLRAVAPHSEESMKKGATLVLMGKVVAIQLPNTKVQSREDCVFARDRIFKVTVSVSDVEKGEAIGAGEELTLKLGNPPRVFHFLSGPQGHQPVHSKGDLIKVYLLYNAHTKTHHPTCRMAFKSSEKKI